jgi:glycosyltransferase involved in cell wall biosynthesis
MYHHLPPGGALNFFHQLVGRVSDGVAYTVFTPQVDGTYNPVTRLVALRREEKRIAEEINSGGFDVVAVHASQITQAPGLIRLVHLPTVYYMQEPRRASFEPGYREALRGKHRGCLLGLPRELAARLYEAELRRSDVAATNAASVLVANSRFTAEKIKAAYDREALVCHLGVDTETFALAETGRSYQVISVGAIDPTKGHDFVIRAIARIATPRPLLAVVGERLLPGYDTELRALALEVGVELTIHQGVPLVHLRELYQVATVTACAAVGEPFGLTPLESASCGTPVVAVDSGGYRETIEEGKTGRLVLADLRSFRAALEEVLAGKFPATPREIRAAVVDRWSWDHAVRRWEEILVSAAKRQRAASTPLVR